MWRRPHLARRLAKLTGKLFEFSLDFIPLKAPRREIAVDINRSSISTVQSGAGDLDRPTSAPVQLFLCSLTPGEVRELFAGAALVTMVRRSRRIDFGTYCKTLNSV